MLPGLPRILLYLLSYMTFSNAVLVNVTVDDSLPDPITGQVIKYLPEDRWKAGAGCNDCTASLDGQQTYSGTWHDSTYVPGGPPINATFKFNGTAIYVFCAIALSTKYPNGYSNMSFYIDGEFVHHFESIPPGIQKYYHYNVSVYSNTSLSPGIHTFMLQNGQYDNIGNRSLTLLDYLVYSYDDGKPSPSPSPVPDTAEQSKMPTPIGIIAGVAVTAGLAILGGLVWFLRRQKFQVPDNKSFSLESSRSHNDHLLPQPFITRSDYPMLSQMEQSASFLPAPITKTRLSAAVDQQTEYSASRASLPVAKCRVSSMVTTHSGQQRAVDAGPVEVGRQAEVHEGFLPPDYLRVFSSSSTLQTPAPYRL